MASASNGKRRASNLAIVLVVIAISTLIKFTLVWSADDLVLAGDQVSYVEGAKSVASSGLPSYSNPRWDEAHASPLYPYFLGASYALFGESEFMFFARIFQVVISMLMVLMVYLIAARTFPPRTALLATIIAAFYPALIAYSHYIFSETIYTFFLLGLTLILLRTASKPSLALIFLAGMLGGLAALTRSVFISQVPIVLLWMLFAGPRGLIRRGLGMAIFVIGMAVVIAPWSATISLRYDHFLLIDTNSGNVLWRNVNGLRPENHDTGMTDIATSGARNLVRGFEKRRRTEVIEDLARTPIRMPVDIDHPVERNSAEIRAAIAYIFEYPGQYIRNCAIRAIEYVNPTSLIVRTIRRNGYPDLGPIGAEVVIATTIGSVMLLLLFGVIGLTRLQWNEGRLLMFGLIAGNVVISVLVISGSRYRMPMIPLLIPFAAHAALELPRMLHFRQNRVRWLIAGPVICVMIAGWTQYMHFNYQPSAPQSEYDRPNIVLISIDSLRADHLGAYGYKRATSPSLDRIANKSYFFTDAVSQAPWTLPSHVSLLTSLHPRTHRTTEPERMLSPDALTLPSLLQEAGYNTHAIVSGTFMQPHFGMDKGFDSYDSDLASPKHRKSHSAITSPEIHARARDIIREVEEPFFLFLHYWDVHYDYLPPKRHNFDRNYKGKISSKRFMHNKEINRDMDPRDLRHLVAGYDGEIAFVDEHIDDLFHVIARNSLMDNTIMVVVADHGDEFFEHGEKGHQHSLYQELLHVPLMIRLPRTPLGKRLDQRVQMIDVMPTLLDFAGIEIPPALEGRSLRPLMEGGELEDRPIFAETTKAQKDRSDKERSTSWAVYDGQYKLITFDQDRYPPELYDLTLDPKEKNNLIDQIDHTQLLEQLGRWFENTPLGAITSNEGLDDETKANLSALGYMGDEEEHEDTSQD